MKPERFILLFSLLAAVVLTPCLAQKPVKIRLGTMAPQGSPWHDVLLQMKQEWREISNGQIEITVYSGVLGDEAEMIRKMRIGQLQAVAISGAALPRIDQGVSCLQIPLLFDSYEELDYVRDRLAPRLEQRIAQQGFVVLNWSDAGWVHFFTRKPARTPDDLRSLKLLTSAGDPKTESLYKDFGLRVVPLPYTEVLMALETGLIEAVQGPPLYAMLDQWFGLADNMTELRWAPLVGATVIRKDTWEKIPPATRASMLASARRAGDELREKIRSLGEEAVPEMEKRGLTVVRLDETAIHQWRTESEKAYPRLRGVYAPAELFDEAVRLRDAFRRRKMENYAKAADSAEE
jgi:TRAP-type C4-dicarboxylate transport system substrate-binding protein